MKKLNEVVGGRERMKKLNPIVGGRKRNKATKEEEGSIGDLQICIGIYSKNVLLNQGKPTYKDDFYSYEMIDGVCCYLHKLEADPKTGLLPDSLYIRGKGIFPNCLLDESNDGSNNYKKFTGFFLLYHLMPLQEIRIYIFRFIGALLLKESFWRYIDHIGLFYADWLSVLQDIKKKTLEEVCTKYFEK